MDIPLDEVIYVEAISSSSTGAAADADSTPTFAVYEEATDTDIGVGGNMTKRTSLAGDYRASFTASAANGFELGKWYSVIGSATIGGIATKGVLARFRIIAAELVAGYPPADALKINGVSTSPVTTIKAVQGLAVDGVITTVTNQLTAAAIATGVWQDTTSGDFTVASSIGKTLYIANIAPGSANGLAIVGSAMTLAASQHVIVDSGTVTTVTNQLTAAQIATGVWQDATAGDFSQASSIGKALYIANIAPGAASGHAIVGSNMGTTTSLTGDAYLYLTTNMGLLGVNLTAADDAVITAIGTLNNLSAAQVWALVDGIETGVTPKQAMQRIAASAIGKVSGAGTGTEIFVGIDGVTTRATVTVDASGNRTAIVYV